METTNMNTWQKQYKLMEISNQFIATKPELNKTSLLYVALIMEELSELNEAILKPLLRDHGNELFPIYSTLSLQCDLLHKASLSVREELAHIQDFTINLTEAETVEIADASTDIAVVNCGFAVSTGFDGQACYDETVGSNLSKANPETGIIDKTPDGKWIKGSQYRVPDLKKVIFGDKK